MYRGPAVGYPRRKEPEVSRKQKGISCDKFATNLCRVVAPVAKQSIVGYTQFEKRKGEVADRFMTLALTCPLLTAACLNAEPCPIERLSRSYEKELFAEGGPC